MISEAQRAIVRRAASLCVCCEAVEVRLAAGEAIDIAPYTTAANSLRRLLVDIGLERPRQGCDAQPGRLPAREG